MVNFMFYVFTIIKIKKTLFGKHQTAKVVCDTKNREEGCCNPNNENSTLSDTRKSVPHLHTLPTKFPWGPAPRKMEDVQEPEDLFLSLSSWVTLGKSHISFNFHCFRMEGLPLSLVPHGRWGRSGEMMASVIILTVHFVLALPH